MKFFIVVVLFCGISLLEAVRFRCDYTYFADGNGWYKFHQDEMTLKEAQTICKSEGTEVAAPNSPGMLDVILSFIVDHPNVEALHTGNSTLESIFKPVHMVLLKGGSYTEVSDNDVYPFVCYKSGHESILFNGCGTLDNGYTFDNRTGSCYKYHRKFSTWFRSYRKCVTEGGHFVIINSEIEAQVIKEIFTKNPRSTLPDEAWKDGAFIGVFLATTNGQWVTIEGETIKEAGYDIFSAGEPNNAAGNEFCGSVARNGRLVDDPCLRKLPFICEKRPDSGCEENSSKTSDEVVIQYRLDNETLLKDVYQIDDKEVVNV